MYRKYIKRFLDIVFSLILIIILMPIMGLTIIIIYFNLKLPIHNQKRLREGMYKKTFIMYKIRTKKLDYDHLPPEEQYTNISKIIDILRLNEFPQLFNILKGEMSFVGPRPFIPNDSLPTDEISEKRYLVRPGITGLAQIQGGRFISHKTKLALDIEYYDNLSFLLDLKIILKTPVFVVKNIKKLQKLKKEKN